MGILEGVKWQTSRAAYLAGPKSLPQILNIETLACKYGRIGFTTTAVLQYGHLDIISSAQEKRWKKSAIYELTFGT